MRRQHREEVESVLERCRHNHSTAANGAVEKRDINLFKARDKLEEK